MMYDQTNNYSDGQRNLQAKKNTKRELNSAKILPLNHQCYSCIRELFATHICPLDNLLFLEYNVYVISLTYSVSS